MAMRIDENVDDTLANVDAGQAQLLKYLSAISSNRWEQGAAGTRRGSRAQGREECLGARSCCCCNFRSPWSCQAASGNLLIHAPTAPARRFLIMKVFAVLLCFMVSGGELPACPLLHARRSAPAAAGPHPGAEPCCHPAAAPLQIFFIMFIA